MNATDDTPLGFPRQGRVWSRIKPLIVPLVFVVGLVLFMLWRAPYWAPKPAVFARSSFEEASARAAAENKLLVVDAMAEWCGPCKAMDAGTWPDGELVAWLNEHAVAFQFDVDAQTDLAQRFNIEAMPTIIALRSGSEIGRNVGALSPEEMLKWLKGL